MRRTRTVAPLVAGLLLGLVSCRGGGRPSGKARELTVSVSFELTSLDPHLHNRLASYSVLQHSYEALVAADREMTMRPALAVRWENPDAHTWVFHLRREAVFHDGTPLTARDVEATFQRLLADPNLGASGYVVNIDRVKALDDHVFELHTKTPMAVLLNKLRFVLIAKADALKGNLAGSLVGTGPYALESFEPGTRVSFRRNDAYWGEKPAASRVTLLLGRTPGKALEDARSGRADVVQTGPRLVGENAVPGYRTVRQSGIFVKSLGFDLTPLHGETDERRKSPFRDVRVRRAASLAIDRRALLKDLGLAGAPATQIVPSFIFGFNPDLPQLGFDPVKARALLAEAGHPDGIDVTLHARRLLAETAAKVGALLTAVGIRTTVVVLPDAEYFDLVTSRKAQFFLSRYGCPTGDASDLLDNFVHSSDQVGRWGSSNSGQYSNPQLDALIEESLSVLDMGRRGPLLQRIMAIVMDDLGWVPLYIDDEVYLVREGVLFPPRNDNYVLAQDMGFETK
ncbi:MAG: hypothetical protein JNK60_13045 [Acidobacteria bacterium]|nr:hypothetical protein [Acidobacteriota bacterium]